MLFRFCSLCNRDTGVSINNLRKYGGKVPLGRSRKRCVPDKTLIVDKSRKLIIGTKRPELNFYKGDTYSKFKPIPLVSRGWHHDKSKGDYFFIYPEEESSCKKAIEDFHFEDYNLYPSLCNRLVNLELTAPLEIQRKAIPKILNGHNTVLAAETGCGKTLAYLLPLIHQILEWKPRIQRQFNSPLGLIVTPSRELAIQIGLVAKKLGNDIGISTKIITGGKTTKMVARLPISEVDLVVGSFGVVSKLTTMKIYKLDYVRHIVLDEADALFHETFEEKLKVFMRRLPIGFQQTVDKNGNPRNTQLTLASATMPQRMSEVLGEIVDVNSLVQIVSEKLHHILVTQKFMRLGLAQKPYELLKFIKPKVTSRQPVIIFSHNNATCDWISMFLHECNIDNVNLNGAMPVEVKQGKYANFISGKVLVLSCTNIGSRGLDTLMAKHILNYDFPLDTSDYIHRCGRIGRVGSPDNCRVTNFISRISEIEMVQKIERAIRKGKPIPIVNLSQRGAQEETEIEPDMPQHIIENIDEENSIPF